MDTSTRSEERGQDIKKYEDYILEIEGDLDVDMNIPNKGQILIVSKDQSFLTHGIHKFPAKFFPELPRYLIRKYSSPKSKVIDPMCGSGTVVLEAILNDREGIGVDIDPMACLITKVKTTPLDSKSLQTASTMLNKQVQELGGSTKYVPIIPQFHYRDKWFRSFVLRELAIIRDSIEMISSSFSPETWRDMRDFFRVILSSIIREVSNADPHCTRTVLRKKVVKNLCPGDTIQKFTNSLSEQCKSMIEFSKFVNTTNGVKASLTNGTAIATGLKSASIDLGVTSPPYINAVDYPRTHQLEMYWLGLLGEGPLADVKRHYIGTETVYKNEYEELRITDHATLNSVLKEIYAVDPRRSFIVYKFFEDMENHLIEMKRILKPDARYCIAIGDNLIRGIQVKSHEILAQIAESTGFVLETQFFSQLIRHFIRIPRRERMQGEWVLILRKPSLG